MLPAGMISGAEMPVGAKVTAGAGIPAGAVTTARAEIIAGAKIPAVAGKGISGETRAGGNHENF